MIISVILPLAAAAASSCPVLPSPTACPQVYQIAGTPGTRSPWSLVFLSDGFQEEDLEKYRCAVRRLADGVLRSPLFRPYACRINVYRIDLAASPGRGEVRPHPGCEVHCGPKSAPGYAGWKCAKPDRADAPVRGPARPPCATEDINTWLCFGSSGDCRVAWPDSAGQLRARLLAQCAGAPGATAVVIANSGLRAGGGLAHQGSGLAVVTLTRIEQETGWTLMAHEAGHALFGLYDEYDDEGPQPDYEDPRNVVNAEDVHAGRLPWQDLRTSQEDYCNAPSCCLEGRDPPEGYVGLVEGALYTPCGFFRSMNDCRMENTAKPFCAACRHYVKTLAEGLGLEPCPGRGGESGGVGEDNPGRQRPVGMPGRER